MRRWPGGGFRDNTTRMTYFLASVRSRAEAELVLASGADIVDLKDPGQGALGAVAPGVIRDCLAAIGGRKAVSATVGDVPMHPDTVAGAVAATADLGVDIVKLGIMPGGDPLGCFELLAGLNLRAGLVLVFFADSLPDFDPVKAAAGSGASGVMLDTMGKKTGSLPDHMPLPAIARFVDRTRDAGLQAGVAGSLRADHLQPLLALSPDVIGFRGALCEQGVRGRELDPKACAEIGALIAANRSLPEARFEARASSAMC